MVSCCNRRLYKGNSYEICLPLVDSGVTLVRFYTKGDVIIEKEPEISGDSMCFSFTAEELASLEDGVLRYEIVTDQETKDTNSPYVIVTPADYSGTTLEDIIADAFDSGYTAGQEDCSGSSCNLQSSKTVYLGGFEWSYAPRTEGHWARAPRYMISGSPIHISADTGYDGLEEIQLTGYFHPTEAYDDGYGKGFNSGYTSGVTEQKAKLVPTAITQNGTYSREDGGFSQVEVNVEVRDIDFEVETLYLSEKGEMHKLRISSTGCTIDPNSGSFTIGTQAPIPLPVQLSEIRQDMEGYYVRLTAGENPSDAQRGCTISPIFYDTDGNEYRGHTVFVHQLPNDKPNYYNSGYTAGYDSGFTDGLNACSGETINNQRKDFWLKSANYDFGFNTKWNQYVYTINPDINVTFDSGYTGLENVHIYGFVPAQEAFDTGFDSGWTAGEAEQKERLISTAFTQNGTYIWPNGWSSCTVNVPQTGYTQQDLDNAYASGFSAGYDSGLTDCSGDTPSAATAITITVPQNLKPGDTGSTSVSTSPVDATTNLSYSSSDNSVATVDNNGNITAVGTGTTNICVTDSISQINECAQLTVNNSLLGEGDVSATVLPRLSTSAVPLCSSSNLGSVSKMAIDGVEITPVSAYTFGDTNLHTLDVWYISSTIPYNAFEYADRLKDVVIKDRMTVIGGRAFYWCTGITSVHIGSGITTINNSAFQGDKSLTSITIPDAVSTIGTNIFSGCTSITSATIGTGMTTIPDGMFSVCSALTQVTVNGSVTEIGSEAFNGCKSLTAYPFTNSITVISQSAFKGCESLTSVVLPDSVVSAGTNAFEGCTGLTAVTLSTGLTEIANNMFSSCGTLQSVSLPDSVTKIGERSFEGCSAMTSVVFGSGITEIGDYAFQNCSYLRGIDVPETITKFGAYSFRNDIALQVYGITIRNASVPQVGNQAFASTDDAPIYVPAGSVEAYKTSTALNYYWATYASRIQAIQ